MNALSVSQDHGVQARPSVPRFSIVVCSIVGCTRTQCAATRSSSDTRTVADCAAAGLTRPSEGVDAGAMLQPQLPHARALRAGATSTAAVSATAATRDRAEEVVVRRLIAWAAVSAACAGACGG